MDERYSLLFKQYIQEGKKEEARSFITKYLKKYPDDADAWYLAASVAINKTQRIALLEKTLQVDPLHTNASRVLEKLRNEPRQAQVSVHKVSRKSSPNKLYPVLGLLSLAALLTVAVVVFFLLRDKADKKVALPTLISAQVPESTLTNTPSPAPTLEPSATASPTSSVTPVPTDEPTPTPTLITAAGALLDTQTTIDSLRSIPTTDPNTRPHPTARPRATQTPTKSSDTLFLGSGTRRDPYRYNPELGFSYGLGDRSLVGISGMIHDADDLIQAMNMFNSVAPSGREWVLVVISLTCLEDYNSFCSYSSFLDFELIDNDGRVYEPEFAVLDDDIELPSIVYGEETAAGSIPFIVPKSASGFTLIYTPNLFFDERYFFEVKEYANISQYSRESDGASNSY